MEATAKKTTGNPMREGFEFKLSSGITVWTSDDRTPQLVQIRNDKDEDVEELRDRVVNALAIPELEGTWRLGAARFVDGSDLVEFDVFAEKGDSTKVGRAGDEIGPSCPWYFKGARVRAKVGGVWVRACVVEHHVGFGEGGKLRSFGRCTVEPEALPRTFETVTIPDTDIVYGWE